MKLNITPGPWTYTMPKEGKSKAKISGKNWTFFANVHVRVDNKDSKEGESNLTAIVTAVNNTYHKGINPEAVPEMLSALEALVKTRDLTKIPDGIVETLKQVIQKATL